MLQQRKKDYLQRLLEEFFKRLNNIINNKEEKDPIKKKASIDECFSFFLTNFEVNISDSALEIASKIQDYELSEQYAKLILTEHQLLGSTDDQDLKKALELVDILQKTDSTYSWNRVVLREDILMALNNI